MERADLSVEALLDLDSQSVSTQGEISLLKYDYDTCSLSVFLSQSLGWIEICLKNGDHPLDIHIYNKHSAVSDPFLYTHN